ncbi:CocE/NonD family hydrolase [Mycobacterium sp.]|uniref:CocE/NonD family hydrolase n=1 Tax=Mycobacterium sp. TaxID=1785 RepID=UPI002BC8962C|nr:CocE/NonD family hydrolase [Mycobacterium sp.]HKP42702.1 CocE/NonD family hydrolase [Mycobacterium sp.]
MSTNSDRNAADIVGPFKPGQPPMATGWPGVNHHTVEDGSLLIERDVPVTMRDGVDIRVDVFRPRDLSTDLPVLMAWAPYGKHGGLMWDTPFFRGYDLGFDTTLLSKYTPFEYPDPVWWCARGYAVVFADMRGTWGSDGDAAYWSQQEAHDGYDTVEWAAAQPWSNGKVGLIGCSNLAWAQWYIAATQPPHLAAINPWEGVSDFYREFAFHGGIPETNFVAAWHMLASFSRNQVEDIPAAAAAHPLLDEYWAAKGADLSKIEVPAFVAASWSDHGLHTRGTLEGYRRISSKHKWLLVHGGKKWAAQYSPENLERQLAFFDRFVKNVDRTPVDEWPPVVIEVRNSISGGVFRDENEWPLQRTRYQKLFLTGDAALDYTQPTHTGVIRYDGACGRAMFDLTFDRATELTGYMALRLWFSAEVASDADIFVAVQKLDASGVEVPFHFFAVQEDGHVALGWLRASHRELDLHRSTPAQPVHTHRSVEPLPAGGEPVPLDIEIWPSSTVFEAGETLRLVIQGRDINSYAPMTPTSAHDSRNNGAHRIHTGGRYDSHLLVPVIPTS